MADRTRIHVYIEVEIKKISNVHRCKDELKYSINKKDEEFGLSRLASFRMIDNHQLKTRAFFSFQNLSDNLIIAKAIDGLDLMGSKVSTDVPNISIISNLLSGGH